MSVEDLRDHTFYHNKSPLFFFDEGGKTTIGLKRIPLGPRRD